MTSTKLNSSGDDDYLRELSPFYSFWVDGSARFCDFELFLNPFSNQPIRAHLALLYARCPKIRTLVDEGKIKSGGRLEIQMKSHQPSSTQALTIVLIGIYCDHWRLPSSPSTANLMLMKEIEEISMFFGLYYVAQMTRNRFKVTAPNSSNLNSNENNNKKLPPQYVHNTLWTDIFTHLYDNPKSMPDLEVVIGDRTFRCHRLVLCARSDYFKTICKWGFKEEINNRIELHIPNNTNTNSNEEEEEKAIERIVRFFYGGNWWSGPTVGGAKQSVDKQLQSILEEQCIELWHLSHYFQSDALTKHCEEWLSESALSPRSIGFVWAFAKEHELSSLLDNTRDFFVKHFYECSQVEEFYALPVEFLKSALETGDIEMEHERLFTLIRKWSVRKVGGVGVGNFSTTSKMSEFQNILSQLLPPATLFCTQFKTWLISGAMRL